jgi:hypothetical protein
VLCTQRSVGALPSVALVVMEAFLSGADRIAVLVFYVNVNMR